MKSTLLAILILCAATSSYAQSFSSPDTLRYRNELGIDATPFIKNILDFDDNSGPGYSPVYYLTYRRYIGRGAVRAAIGGAFSSSEREALSTSASGSGDTMEGEFRSRRLEARLGYEFYTPLARRWQLYYGADARLTGTKSTSEERSGSGINEIERTSESSFTSYGIAPLLGIRFRLTPRISLRTEASFAFLRTTDESETRTRLLNPGPLPANDQVSSRTAEGFATSFQQPLSLFITFDL